MNLYQKTTDFPLSTIFNVIALLLSECEVYTNIKIQDEATVTGPIPQLNGRQTSYQECKVDCFVEPECLGVIVVR